VLGFYDENFLASGFNRSQDAAFMVNDMRGIEVVQWTHGQVMNYSPATQTLTTMSILRLDDGGGAFDDRFRLDFKRQPDGSWKLWGDHLHADINVKIQMNTTANGPGRFNEGPTQKAFVSGTSAQGTVQEVRVTGAGVFNNAVVTKSAGSVQELVQADPPPAERESIFKDSFFTSANTALSSPADFSVTVTPVSGAAQTYTVRSNTVTNQFVTITSPTTHTLTAANLGGPLTVHWTLPAFQVDFIEFTGTVRTIADSNSGSQCRWRERRWSGYRRRSCWPRRDAGARRSSSCCGALSSRPSTISCGRGSWRARPRSARSPYSSACWAAYRRSARSACFSGRSCSRSRSR